MSLGIYIQIPFCQTKCTYCNFYTGVVPRERYKPYATALCREITEAPEIAAAQVIDTIYFGGGTPSLLDPADLGKILESLRSRAQVAPRPEITLEADPETIDSTKATAWRKRGFNRISLGVQSFHDNELKAAGRMHRRTDIFAANEILRAAGLANISMDLIAGLPHQTRDSWESSVSEILTLKPEHISIYLLEVDEGSRLGREALAGGAKYSASQIPSDDDQASFYESACEWLAAAGYEHYEISNWALPARRSRHNMKYWQREPYLGFGAGAHSFHGETRWANVHDSASYAARIESGQSTREQIEPVTAEQTFDEEIFLGLRQLGGIDFAVIAARYEKQFASRLAGIEDRLAELQRNGLVEIEGSRVRLAPARLAVSNEVFVELLGVGA